MDNENLEAHLALFLGKPTCSKTPLQMLACSNILANISVWFHLVCFTSKMFVRIPELVYPFFWSCHSKTVSYHTVMLVGMWLNANVSCCRMRANRSTNCFTLKYDQMCLQINSICQHVSCKLQVYAYSYRNQSLISTWSSSILDSKTAINCVVCTHLALVKMSFPQ